MSTEDHTVDAVDPDRLDGPGTAIATKVFPQRFATAAGQRRGIAQWYGQQSGPVRALLMLATIAFFYALPAIGEWGIIGQITQGPQNSFSAILARTVILFVIVALGLNVVVGLAGLLDLGYVGFYAVGAYTLAIVCSYHATIPWILGIALAVPVSMLFGVVLGTPTLRLRGDYLAIVTLGFGEIIRIITEHFKWFGGADGIAAIPGPPDIPLGFTTITFGPLDVRSFYWLGLTFCIVIIFFLRRLERSRVGRAWTAIREDEDAAELMGVPTFRFKLWAFAIGAAVGGIAGALYASNLGAIQPASFVFQLSILFLAAVVLGGPGNMPGVILGAAIVSYLPERFRVVQEWRFFIFGTALVLLMLFRPQGLIPRKLAARQQPDDDALIPDPREGDPDLEGGQLEGTPGVRRDGI